MANEADMNIDYEKLRKKLVRREFLKSLITGTPAYVGNCANAHEATPEELIRMSIQYNINLDRYRINNSKE